MPEGRYKRIAKRRSHRRETGFPDVLSPLQSAHIDRTVLRVLREWVEHRLAIRNLWFYYPDGLSSPDLAFTNLINADLGDLVLTLQKRPQIT
jgi:hypothetical protein